MLVVHIFFILFSLISFVSVFWSVGELMLFLSSPFKTTTNNKNDSAIFALLIDSFLLSTFMLQHTLMALPKYKEYLEKFGLNVLSRSIYNLVTSVILMILVKYWSSTEYVFWNIDTNNSVVYYIFCAAHLFAWSVIYTGCLLMDFPEMLGVKQVYYCIRKMPNPMELKSVSLRRLYGHMRHPSFTAFVIILWVYPVMSLDRFIIALLLSTYMYFAWKTDSNDYKYQKHQYIKKTMELSDLR